MPTATKSPPQVQWKMKGQYLSQCSCDAGCPCQFNREPTHHVCEGALSMNVVKGNYGDVSLDGVKWVAVFKFPGPIHEGNATAQAFIDSKTNQKQRDALLQILSGSAGGPWYELVKAVVANMEEPQFVPIDFEFDLKKRKARIKINGAYEALVEPVKNPITGDEHHAQIALPDGIEYKVAEVANAVVSKGLGKLKFNWPNSNALLSELEHDNKGVNQTVKK